MTGDCRRLQFRGCVLVVCTLIVVSNVVAGTPPDDAAYVGNETCAMCHDEIGAEYPSTMHGQVYWSGSSDNHVDCESCHGPGSAHSDGGDASLIANPGNTDEPGNSDWCLSCHTEFHEDQVLGDAHYALSGGCADCHNAHETESTLRQASSNLCLDCHTDIRAQTNMPSRHPIKEGLMQCTDCHDPHGQETMHTATAHESELCFSCHASKEGPFIFEHEPVIEDCGICHNPHGTVADNLLVQTEPALCLSCHQMHFHTQLAGIEGEFTMPVYPERHGESSIDGFKEAMLTKCTQCHIAIHGTDEPAQSITAPGALSR